MSYKEIIQKEIFPNKIVFFIIDDNLLSFDLIIKFKNYGSALDKHYGVSGFQHLLEHAIFYQDKNLNIPYNASTTPNYMSLELGLTSNQFKPNNDPSILILKKWLFQNNDFTRVNLSRNISLEDINNYIKELDNEYLFRSYLDVPWDLQTFLLTNGGMHYFGGNKYTFEEKQQQIFKLLTNPYPISPENIVIFLKKSKQNYFSTLRNIFINLKPIKTPKISLSYEPDNYYNKIIQINNGNTNQLIFTIQKQLIKNIDILFIIKFLYPFFSFEINDYISQYYISFSFIKFHDLYKFMFLLENSFTELFKLKMNDYPYFSIDEMILDLYPNSILNLFNDKKLNSRTNGFFINQYIDDIKGVFHLFYTKLLNKEFIINSTKQYLYNNITDTKEKYFITPINFNDDYFYDFFYYNYDINNIVYQIKNHNQYNIKLKKNININIKKNKILCFPNHNIINMNKNIVTNYSLHYLINDLKFFDKKKVMRPHLDLYFESLIAYFISPTNSLETSIIEVLQNKIKINNIDKNINIKLNNNTYDIKTEFDFLFVAVKAKIPDIKKITHISINIQEQIKRKGLSYYLGLTSFLFKSYGILFFFTNSRKEGFDPLINVIKSSIISNNIKNFNCCIVKSNKTATRDFSRFDKKVNISC